MAYKVDHLEAFKRRFTQEDFNCFADINGDNNPIHVDPQFSARTRFGRTVCRAIGTGPRSPRKHFPAAGFIPGTWPARMTKTTVTLLSVKRICIFPAARMSTRSRLRISFTNCLKSPRLRLLVFGTIKGILKTFCWSAGPKGISR